jgi:hypothetical protein
VWCNALKKRHRRQILLTSFTQGADTRRVVFMNPNAASSIEVAVPPAARLVFGAGLNPAVRGLIKAPVLFAVAINGEPAWSREIVANAGMEEPKWEDADLDLAAFAGRRIRLAFITRSAQTDHAWAGWAEPAIATDGLSLADRFVNFVLDLARAYVAGGPLRHP